MKLSYVIAGTVATIALINDEGEVERSFDVDTNEINLDLADGESTKSIAAYGIIKLLQDRTSSSKESKTVKFEGMEEELNRILTDGVWRKPVTRTGGTGSSRARKVDSFVAIAVAELKGISVEAATNALKAVEKEQYDELCKNQAVVDAVKLLKANAADETDNVDLADLL